MMDYLYRIQTRRGALIAVVIASCLLTSAPSASASKQCYYTGFGETLGERGCDKVHGMVIAFHQTAQNMRRMKKIPDSDVDEAMIRDYLSDNLELADLPPDSAEYKIFSRLTELIMNGEDRETVQAQTREVCEREFGSQR